MIRISKWLKQTVVSASALVVAVSLCGAPVTVAAQVDDDAIYTQEGYEDYSAELKRNKAQPVQTNQDPAWPAGPAIGAAGAVVMDADSGAVLYGKNMDRHLYPASITKIMTALLAYENLKPADTVTFSENAVFGIEMGSSNIGMDVGESITMDQALYGLMVASANEVAIALGERISGSEPEFIDLMNERAAELGCRNTHFVTANGLHDPDHYTCAYDMALIAREIFRHPGLVAYMSQPNYHFEASANQPDDFWIGNTNDFLTGEISCDDIIGGKTGYTDQARETLVSFAERDGKHLICVIMREEPPYQYYDTIDLLNYAFDNFKKISIAGNETRFTQKAPDFLSAGTDIFGNSRPAFRISESATLMIPRDLSFSDLTAQIMPVFPAPGQESTQGISSPAQTSPDSPDSASAKEQDAVSPADLQSTASSAGKTSAGALADNSAAEITPVGGTADNPKDASPSTDRVSDAESSGSAVSGSSANTLQTDGDGNRILGVVQYKFHEYDLGTVNIVFWPDAKAAGYAEAAGTAAPVPEAASIPEAASTPETSSTPTASSTGETAAAADSPSADDRTDAGEKISVSEDYVVPEHVHGLRAMFFGLVHTGAHGAIYLNILLLLPLILAVTFVLCIFFFIRSYFIQLEKRRRARQRRSQRAIRHIADEYADYKDPLFRDFDTDSPAGRGFRTGTGNRGANYRDTARGRNAETGYPVRTGQRAGGRQTARRPSDAGTGQTVRPGQSTDAGPNTKQKKRTGG